MRRTISLVCSLLAGAAFAAGAESGTHPSDATADQSPLAQAPAAVRKTIEREAHGQPVQSLSAKQEYGHTVYTAVIAQPNADQPLRLKVAEDGGIVWRDDLKERARKAAEERSQADHAESGSSSGTVPSEPKQDQPKPQAQQAPQESKPKTGRLAIEELPDPVKQTLLRQSDGRSISDIEGKERHGKIEYRAKYRDRDGKAVKIRINPDGNLIDQKK